VPRNLELKCRIASVADAGERARLLGATPQGVLIQEDTYFPVPHGRMKLREFGDGASELIAYERPNQEGERWSTYRKVDVSGCRDLKAALCEGIGVSRIVKKKRRLFLIPGARIHLDEVENLGNFLEFEVTLPGMEEAGALMKKLMDGFGVRAEDGIAGSYADMRPIQLGPATNDQIECK
jgi:adenylate cyclase class IV